MTAPVLVFGVDGADHGLVGELLDAGRLPTIARLRAAGAYGALRSTEPPITPVAWSTFLTGLLPGRHGIFNFSTNPYRQGHRVLSAADRDGTPIWRFVDAAGRRTVLALVPFTYPVEPVGGVVISGYGGPETPAVDPPEAADRIARMFPGLVSARHPMRDRYWEDYDGFRRKLIDDVAMVERLCAHLLEHERPDLFCVDFMSSDTIGHLAYHFRDPSAPAHEPARAADHIGEVYAAVDAAIGRLIEHAEREYAGSVNTVVISDHGMQPIHYAFHVNRWLEQRGHLRYRRRSLQRTRGLARIDSRLAMTRPWYPRLYDRIAPYGRAPDEAERTMRDVDRWRTDAYAYGTGGPIYFGEATGRRHDRGFQEALIAELLDERSPIDGTPALNVRRAEDVFTGPHLDAAPDLVLTARDPRVMIDSSRRRWPDAWVRHTDLDPSHNYGYSGHHGPTGILAAAGPAVPTGEPAGAGIEDLAPTILAMMGIEAAGTSFDGRVLEGFGAGGDTVAAAAVERPAEHAGGAVYSDDEERAIRERLEALGYE